jgi:hypothetical protein
LAVDKIQEEFDAYVQFNLLDLAGPVTVANASVHVLINFLTETRLQHGKSVDPAASHLLAARGRAGGTPLAGNFLWDRFRKGARRSALASRRAPFGALPFAPRVLLPALPVGSDLASVRDRALVLLRIVSLLRPGEPHTIPRSSVKYFVDSSGRPLVVFRYISKNASRFGFPSDGNYVEFLADELLARFPHMYRFCPARNLLSLVDLVDGMPAARDHDRLWVSTSGAPLSRDSVCRIVRDLVRSVSSIDDRWTGHSLRAMSQQALSLLGVHRWAINLRAGWTSRLENATVASHYSHFRIVPGNFAELLLFPPGTFSTPSVSNID